MKESKQTTPMTFAELVDETVAHYTINPRSTASGTGPCQYAGPNGERCAAARLCDESLTNFWEMDNRHDTAWSQVNHLATLKPEYAHFGVEEIQNLQKLHDSGQLWLKPDGERGTEGLTDLGEKFVERIKSNPLEL